MSLFTTPVYDLARLAATNLATDDFAALVPTATAPSGDGMIEWAGGMSIPTGGRDWVIGPTNHAPNWLQVIPFGAGDEDSTFDLRVTGWSRTEDSSLWVPVTLAQVTCTLSAAVGVAGKLVINTERFADTIVQVLGSDSMQILSPADDTIASVLIDGMGFRYLQITADLGTATGANALIKKL